MANERAMPADPTLSDRNPRRRRYRKGQEICQEDQFQRQRRTLEGNRSKRERGYQGDTYLPDYHETMVHYNKSFGVLQELFDHRDFVGFVEELHGLTPGADNRGPCELCGHSLPMALSEEALLHERMEHLVWLRRLMPLQGYLPISLELAQAKLCFSSNLHDRSLQELASKSAASHTSEAGAGCYTLLAALTEQGRILGCFTDFAWRCHCSGGGFGDVSSECFVFSLADGAARVYRGCCRGSVLRLTADRIRIGHQVRQRTTAVALDSSLLWVSSDKGDLFRNPCLLDTSVGSATTGVDAVACLSWSHLEPSEGEEQLPLALQSNQDTFMLNFIGTSVRSQLAAKAGSSWC